MHALVARGVDADGYRQVLGMQVTSSEDGAGWRNSATSSPKA